MHLSHPYFCISVLKSIYLSFSHIFLYLYISKHTVTPSLLSLWVHIWCVFYIASSYSVLLLPQLVPFYISVQIWCTQFFSILKIIKSCTIAILYFFHYRALNILYKQGFYIYINFSSSAAQAAHMVPGLEGRGGNHPIPIRPFGAESASQGGEGKGEGEGGICAIQHHMYTAQDTHTCYTSGSFLYTHPMGGGPQQCT